MSENGEYTMPEAKEVTTAFIVVIDRDGSAWADSDITKPLQLDRKAHLNDMYRSCAEVMKDIEVMDTSERVVARMIQATAQIAEQQKAAELAKRLDIR